LPLRRPKICELVDTTAVIDGLQLTVVGTGDLKAQVRPQIVIVFAPSSTRV